MPPSAERAPREDGELYRLGSASTGSGERARCDLGDIAYRKHLLK